VARELGPDDGSLRVRTYREGVAARVGHDLVLEATRWTATVDGDAIGLRVDPASLAVREALHGAKPLSDGDRRDIARNIERTLGSEPITFTSTEVRAAPDALEVSGTLTIAGTARPMAPHLDRDADGRVSGTITLRQSDWGIKPYRGLMGALKVRDEVEVAIEARLPER
jgi:hypothetical protein